MSTAIAIYAQRREELKKAIEKNRELLTILPPRKQEEFKKNFVELANNDYLLNNTNINLVVKLAIDLTKIGLDINPFKKEVYIVPFETKINNQKMMVPQAIIPMKGIQEIYIQANFLLKVFKVWDIGDGIVKSEADMSYKELSLIDETDKKFRDSYFIGFDVRLIDLKDNLPEQRQFVSYKYTKSVVKNMKVPEEFYLEGLVHKAVRKASRYFVIPKERMKDIVDETETANETLINEKEIEPLPNKTAKPSDPLLLQKQKQEDMPKAKEVIKEKEAITVDSFRELYKRLSAEKKGEFLGFTEGVDLNSLSKEALESFYEEVKEHVGA